MTRSELTQRLSKSYPHIYQRDIEAVVATIIDSMAETLLNDGRIELRGFGAFSIRRRSARKARNPKNGKEVQIGDRCSIYFRAGKDLRQRVNKLRAIS